MSELMREASELIESGDKNKLYRRLRDMVETELRNDIDTIIQDFKEARAWAASLQNSGHRIEMSAECVAMSVYSIGYWFAKDAISAIRNDAFEVKVTYNNIFKSTEDEDEDEDESFN